MIEQADGLRLFDCLPQFAPPRGGGGGTSFATGAFVKVKVGLRSSIAVFLKTAEVLAAFIRQSAPAHKFTTIVVFDSVQITPHRNQQNSCLPNLAVPVTSFSQVSIWVQLCNEHHARQMQSVHRTDAWAGRSVVLVLFHVGCRQAVAGSCSAFAYAVFRSALTR